MSEIIPLRLVEAANSPFNAEIVGMVEELLAEVRDGRVTELAVVIVRPDNGTATAYSSNRALGLHLLVSGAATLMARLTRYD